MITDPAPDLAGAEPTAPEDRRAPAWARRVIVEAVAAGAAIVGPTVNAAVSPANRWWMIVGVGVAASAVLALLGPVPSWPAWAAIRQGRAGPPERAPDQWWPARLVLIVGVAVVLERAEGPMLGAWTALGLLLTDWAVRRRRPLPFVPVPDPVAGVVVPALLVLAARQATDVNSGGRPLRLVVVALVVAAAGALTGDLMTRGVRTAITEGVRFAVRTDARIRAGRRRRAARWAPDPSALPPEWAEVPSSPPSRRAFHLPVVVPVVVLSLLAMHRVVVSGWGPRALLLLAGAVALVAIDAYDGTLLPRMARRLGHAAGHLVGRVAFLVLGVLLLLLPWFAHRVFRVDPLGPRPTGRTGWVARTRLSTTPRHPWGVETLATRPKRWYRIRRAVAVPVLLGMVALVLLADHIGALEALGARFTEPETPAAYADAEWYPDYREDITWIMDEADGVEFGLDSTSGAWWPYRPQRIGDVHTRTVNVSDGVRESWVPPCGCDPVVVWMFGGSTGFGIGQRDEHTIASELARAAWADGVAVEVRNWGVPGDTHRGEAQRLAWELTNSPPPDLVIFYDGANEEWATGELRTEADVDQALDPLHEIIFAGQTPGRHSDPPPGGSLVESPALGDLAPDAFAHITMERYERARDISRGVGQANDVPIRWFWQPVQTDRPPVAGEPTFDPASQQYFQERRDELRRLLADDVIDVSGVLDDVDHPLYSDGVHHNEEGARIVAAALYEALRADLALLADGEEIDP